MQRQFIAELQARDQVDEIYRVVDKQVRANRQGADYLLLQLMDRSGQISGLRWNAGQSLYESFAKGDFLRVVGGTQLHNGMLQLIVQDFQVVPLKKSTWLISPPAIQIRSKVGSRNCAID